MDIIKEMILEKLVSGELDFEIESTDGEYSLRIFRTECEVSQEKSNSRRRKRLTPEQAAEKVYSVLPGPEDEPLSTTEVSEAADLSRSTVLKGLRLLAADKKVKECSGNETKFLTWRRLPIAIRPGEAVN